MQHRHHGCGPRGHIEIRVPEALLAMRGGRGWQGNWGPFHFDFGDEGWSGGRRGRRARRMFEGGELRLVLLKLIADEPRHGYDLIRAIEELTGGEYAPSPGVVYPTLTLLEEMGYASASQDPQGRKLYTVTPEGEKVLAENKPQVDAIFERFGDRETRFADFVSVKRAMLNLRSALQLRLRGRDATPEQIRAIVDALDAAAKAVERA